MTHVRRFQGIPMSTSMRGICKEEDYAFLGGVKMPDEDEDYEYPSGSKNPVCDSESWRSRREERVQRRMEREQKERERLRELEESKMEKERRWRRHVAELSSSQEADVRERLSRLRSFRMFQRRVLMEGCGMEPSAAGLLMDQRLSRI
ncbi:unnamed protein product [Gadus morhua 'NCC']